VTGWKRKGIVALFVVFTAFGVLMLFDAGSRAAGIVTILFFGGGGLMWFLITRPRRGPLPGFRIGSVSSAGGHLPALIADYDPRRLLIAGLGLVAMAAASAIMAAAGLGDAVERVVLVGCALLFGVLGLVSIVRWRAGNRIALTRRGLSATTPFGHIEVDWDDIVRIGEVEVHANRLLALTVADPSRVRMRPHLRMAHWLQRSMMGVDLTFPLTTLLVRQEELTAALERYRTDRDARGRIGNSEELADLLASVPPLPGAPEEVEPREHRPIGPRLAAGALLLVGAVLALFVLVGVLDGDVTAAERRSRTVGMAIVGVVAAGHLGAWALLRAGRNAGRWLGIGSGLLLLLLAILGTVTADPGARGPGAIATAVVAVPLVIVVWGTRGRPTWNGAQSGE
jgi:hypothetical protein